MINILEKLDPLDWLGCTSSNFQRRDRKISVGLWELVYDKISENISFHGNEEGYANLIGLLIRDSPRT